MAYIGDSITLVCEQRANDGAIKLAKEKDLRGQAFPKVEIGMTVGYSMLNHASMPNLKSNKNLTGCPRTKTQSNLPQDWYQAIIASSIDSFFIANLQGEFLDVSDAFCRILGYSRHELLTMNLQGIEALETPEEIRQHGLIVKSLGGGLFNTCLRSKNGQIIEVQISANYLGDDKDLFFVFVRDIIQQKRLSQKLKESEESYRTLFDNVPVGIGIATYDGKILAQNRAMLQMTGYSEEEIGQINLRDTYQDTEDRALLLKHMQKEGFVRNLEVTLKRKDDTPYHVSLTNVPFNLDGEEVLLTVVQDITERTKAYDRYKAIIQTTPDGFFLGDLRGSILDVNDAFCRMLGYSREELLSMTVCDFDIEFIESPEKFRQGILKDEEDKCILDERKIKCKDGRIIDVAISVKYLDIKPSYFFCFNRDITEQKRMEEELKQYSGHLEELVAKRTAELEEQLGQRVKFTRALVHELKTPLTPLIAASDFLVSRLNEEPLSSFAKNINKGALNLSSKIDELLDLAKGEVGILKLRYGQVEFLQLLEDTVGYMKAEASRNNQSLILDKPSCCPMVWADEKRLRQVLLNLLDNAFKFTPKGGEITLKAREKNAGLVVEVKDNGCGMDEEAMKHLFEPYRRQEGSKASLSGLGLGLPLSKMLIELHGGKIWTKSQQGKGSTFSFWLPLNHKSQKKKEQKKI